MKTVESIENTLVPAGAPPLHGERVASRDLRVWRELVRTMPLEVQRAIAGDWTPWSQIELLDPAPSHPAAGMRVVEFRPSRRAALFRAADSKSQVIWGQLFPGRERMLTPVLNADGEVIAAFAIDLLGWVQDCFTAHEYDQLSGYFELSAVVEDWAVERRPRQGEVAAMLDCLDGEVVPTESELDVLWHLVRARAEGARRSA